MVVGLDREIASEEYMVGGDVCDPERVYSLFAKGATIILNAIDRRVPKIAALCDEFETFFGFPVQANAYLTPPKAQGFAAHYDDHDVFVVQTAGNKSWYLYGTPIELPTSRQSYTPGSIEIGSAKESLEMKAGDLAYLPRGLVHEARSGMNTSLHITIGVLSYTLLDVLEEVVAEIGSEFPHIRRSLPVGLFPLSRSDCDASCRYQWADLFKSLVDSVDVEKIIKRFDRKFVSSKRWAPSRSHFAQLEEAQFITLFTRLRLRSDVEIAVDVTEDGVSVCAWGKRVIFPISAEPALKIMLSAGEFSPAELPGDIDDESRLTLARRLILEGLIVAGGLRSPSRGEGAT
jgi:ribosomal protein L16 Arg81 hydroxylase